MTIYLGCDSLLFQHVGSLSLKAGSYCFSSHRLLSVRVRWDYVSLREHIREVLNGDLLYHDEVGVVVEFNQ